MIPMLLAEQHGVDVFYSHSSWERIPMVMAMELCCHALLLVVAMQID
jgi:cytochrome c oxidase subunit IV